MAERARDRLGLIDVARPDRARVDLDEADDVGILGLDEVGDPLQVAAIAEEVAHAGQRPMQGGSEPEAVADVVQQ